MRTAIRTIAVLLLMSSHALADDGDIALRKYHPWGRFHVGSWARVRVTTELLDETGTVVSTSISDTQSTLMERGLESYTLKLDTTVVVDGQKIPSEPKTVKLGYAGENTGEQLTYCNIEETSVSIDGRRIPCEVQEIEIISAGQKRVSLVRYADSVAPFVLQRKTTDTDLQSPLPHVETEFEVIALEMPYRVCGSMQNTAQARQVQRGPNGTTVTLSVLAAGVPGELVTQTTQKTDDKNRLTHRSSLELMAYHVASAPPVLEEAPDVRLPRRYHKRARNERRQHKAATGGRAGDANPGQSAVTG